MQYEAAQDAFSVTLANAFQIVGSLRKSNVRGWSPCPQACEPHRSPTQKAFSVNQPH